MSTLFDKFPGLARYDQDADQGAVVANIQEDPFTKIFLDALKKTDAAARQRYCGAFFAGVNFLAWARDNAGADFGDYLDTETKIDDLWCKKAPEESFIAALRVWAGAYLYLARRCHWALIDEINAQLKGEELQHGLG